MSYELLELGAQYKVGLITLEELERAVSIAQAGDDCSYYTAYDILHAVETNQTEEG